MSRLLSCDAIVLATYNVGEADRFCVLFTKECGRLAARASAARKTGSRLGAALLPFHRVQVELREWNNGYVVTGARRNFEAKTTDGITPFLAKAEIVELLLMLLQEGEPLPELFESVTNALENSGMSPLPHTVRILHLLGHMPSVDMPHFSTFTHNEQVCIEAWIRGEHGTSALSAKAERTLSSLCAQILSDHTGKRQNVPEIKRVMAVAT